MNHCVFVPRVFVVVWVSSITQIGGHPPKREKKITYLPPQTINHHPTPKKQIRPTHVKISSTYLPPPI